MWKINICSVLIIPEMVAIRKASVALAFAPPPGDLHRGIRHSRPLPRAFPCFQHFPLLCSGLFACGGSFRIGGRANHSDSKTTLRATIPSEISDGEVTVKTDDIFDPSADEINGSNDDNAISTSDNLYDPPNDDDLDLDFDSCVIPENLDVFSYKDCSDEANRSAKSLYGESTGGTEVDLNRNIDLGLKAIPLLAPIVAFLTYGSVAKLYTAVLDYIYSYRAFTSVDGGAYEIQIITPAVNGIVLPTMTILFATLTSNTVADLRQRQLDIRTCLNTEAGELRVLSSLVDVYENKEMAGICRMYLKQYTSRLIAESQPGMDVNQFESRGSMDSEMNGFVYQLNLALSRENESRVSPDLITESYGAVVRLNSERATRISALQSTYPVLHYAILGLLAASIGILFLLETNQAIILFLNAIQIRVLWTMLIGTFASLAVVLYDLANPFRGSYQVRAPRLAAPSRSFFFNSVFLLLALCFTHFLATNHL